MAIQKLITGLGLVVLLAACSSLEPKQNIDPQANYWQSLGTVLDVNLIQYAYLPSLALDSSGNPVVSWHEDDGTSSNIYVKRWTGSSWQPLGSFLDVNTNLNAFNPSLALDSSGNPVVS
jgi:hypothetical protein